MRSLSVRGKEEQHMFNLEAILTANGVGAVLMIFAHQQPHAHPFHLPG